MGKHLDFDDCYIVEPNTGCWLWTAMCNRNGYGVYGIGNGKRVLAHRYAWERAHGPIPGNLFACHKCDTPSCANGESHIFLGTAIDNARDCVAKGRRPKYEGEENPFSKITNKQRDEIFELRNAGLSQREVGEKFGLSQSHVSKLWIKRGHVHGRGKTHKRARPTTGERNHFSKLTDAERDQVYDLRNVMLQREVAEHYGITQGAVSAIWLKRGHRTYADERPRLSDDVRKAILKLRDIGLSQSKVARMFSVSQPTVWAIWHSEENDG